MWLSAYLCDGLLTRGPHHGRDSAPKFPRCNYLSPRIETGVCDGASLNPCCTDTSKLATFYVVSYLILHFLCVKFVSFPYLGIIGLNVEKVRVEKASPRRDALCAYSVALNVNHL